jgi:hypothetical protein
MLELADLLEAWGKSSAHATALRRTADRLGSWLATQVPLLPNGWVPRRITLEGEPYPLSPEGGRDVIHDHSADGLFLLELWTRLGRHDLAPQLGEAFVSAGGCWGSINHDTYDDHENVAYAVAFRVLREGADVLGQPQWRRFAYDVALPAMARFRMDQDEHGVVTQGLFWMEQSWDTAYLWENAEVAQAHLDAWLECGDVGYRDVALATLGAIAHHHYGPLGFLTEGIDWNNHISQRHHAEFAYYGAIRYTEPLLNNLHLVGPTLTYLEAQGGNRPADVSLGASLGVLSAWAPARMGRDNVVPTIGRYLLRLYHPAIATDPGVAAAIEFAHEAGIDGVLLFEASYDIDPALLSLDVLRLRFERLKAIVPRFREAGLEVHINVMITMGHVDAGGGRPEDFPFQFLVDADGNRSRSTACPLDPAFLDTIRQLYTWAAECDADVLWVDDDVRFLYHDVPAMTCFCPLHLSEMATRTGRAWTREQLAVALAEDGESLAVRTALRKTWLGLQSSAIEGLAAQVASAVRGSSYARSAPEPAIGLMSVGTAIHNAEGRRVDSLLRILSGSAPLLRPGSGFWHDWEPGAVLAKSEDVARQVAYLGSDVRVVAEIENHPYSPFQKSRRILALELALNVLAGTHDLSLNLFSGTMPFDAGRSRSEAGSRRSESGDVGQDYATFLRSQKPFLQALALARRGKRRIGVGIEGRENVAETMPVGAAQKWAVGTGKPVDAGKAADRSLMTLVESRPWELALSRMGLPVGTLYDAPHLWAGDTAYTDRYAIASALQEGVVLTPLAVRGLLEQGWGERLGILDVLPAPPGVNEVFARGPMNEGHYGACLPVRHYAAQLGPHTWTLTGATACRVLSEWVGLDGVTLGPATVALELANGDRLGLLPFEITTVHPALLQPARRDQWAALLAWVAKGPLPLRVFEGVNLVPQVFASPGREEMLVAIANLSADDGLARLDGPALAGFRAVEQLTPEGAWVPLTFTGAVSVVAWSVVVLRTR